MKTILLAFTLLLSTGLAFAAENNRKATAKATATATIVHLEEITGKLNYE